MIPAANVQYMWNQVVIPRLGVAPYAFGGSFSASSPGVGTDCSGAVSAALGAMIYGASMPWARQFWTGTFAGAQPGQVGPFGGVPETAQLICIAHPTDAPPDYAMIVAVYQNSDATQAHMICRVQGIDIEMGGNEFMPDGQERDYHTSLTNPNCNSVMDTSTFNQWFYVPNLDPATPPPPAAPPPPKPTIYGIDISNNTFGGPDTPNLGMIPGFIAQVVKEGFAFIEMKCSQGSTFMDPCYVTAAKACSDNKILMIPYHFADESNPVSQARNCKSVIGDLDYVMIDFEKVDAQGNPTLTIEQLWALIIAMQAEGIKTLFNYLPNWYWQRIGSPDISKATNLIASSWVNGTGYASVLYPGSAWPGWSEYGGAKPVILQFTNQAQVAGMTVDADAFQGPLSDLQALIGGTTPSPSGGWYLNEAQQQDLYNWVMWIFAFLFGALTNNPGNVVALPGSPTPTGTKWVLNDPVTGNGLSFAQALENLTTTLGGLSSDFQQTSTGLAVLQKLAELNSLLASSPGDK